MSRVDIFVARQPILTADEEVVAYELLYRMSAENSFNHTDGDLATTDLLINSFLGFEDNTLSSGKRLFINFTKNLLIKEVPKLLNKNKIVIEILEDIVVDDQVLHAIQDLKKLGYTIALDDFLLTDETRELVCFADIIKVDFLNSSFNDRKAIHRLAMKHNIKLLAEKIETRTDYGIAVKEGFEYFQGYFFSKPVILTTTDVPVYKGEYFSLLAELNKPEPDVDAITSYIQRDLSLSYKLLKIVNTMAYYRRVQVQSIRQAVVVLGLNELKRWITILSLKGQQLTTSANNEILVNSLIRAKLAESIGEELFGQEKKSECFMLGLFSLLETILQKPKEMIVETLPLSHEVKNSLLGLDSKYNVIMDIVLAIENADWDEMAKICFKIPTEKLSSYYREAIKWSTEINETVS